MGFKSNSIFLLLLISIFLNGCQSKVYLMPAPIALNNDGLAFELSDNPNDNNLLYTMYATNRKPAKLTFNNNEYSIFPSDLLRLGFVVHRVGESNMTWDDLQRESLKGDRTDDLLIEKLWSREMAIFDLANNMEQQLDQAEGFFDTINKVIDNMFNKDILLYVHGANSNFYRATAQGAQYFHFTGHNSVVVTFSWPSAENLLKYKVDVLHAKQTVPAFSQLIEVLARHTKAKNINILAYSAGAQVVAPGLAYLRDKYPELTTDEIKKKFRLGELYLAAPDTDFAPFIDRYMKFKDIVERTTININQKDSVLRFAAIQNGISRLGRPDISDLTEKEGKLVLEAIQSDKLDLLNVGDSEPLEITGAHDSWYNHPWVSSDLLLLMLFNATPEERGLVKYRLGNGEEGYYFPEDYDHIIRDIIKKGRTEFEQDFLKAKEKGAIREEASLTN